jgi:hypothetical protein
MRKAMKSKGYAKGGKKAKGMAKGGKKTKGMARGGRYAMGTAVKKNKKMSKGMARGGRYAMGTTVKKTKKMASGGEGKASRAFNIARNMVSPAYVAAEKAINKANKPSVSLLKTIAKALNFNVTKK